MIQLKIYDKSYNVLTAFNTGEFTALSYKKTMGQIGDASFTLDIANSKVTDITLRNYNRVEILDGGVVLWSGYLVTKQITFNQVVVQCKELIGILVRRLTPNAYTLSGNAGTAIGTLLAMVNAEEDTGITMGATDVSASINMTFNQQEVLSALQNIADNVGAQFKVNEARELVFMLSIGTDKSSSVKFEYNTIQPQQANIVKFQVEDNGDGVVTKSYGANSSLTSAQTDIDLKTKYGLLEKFNSFTQANNQGNLDALTLSKISDSLYSPALDLIPGELDNFDVGDTVKINIKNKLVLINDSFQILEKSVKIVNSQKSISVRINQLPQNITNTIRDLQRQVNLLITN